MDPLTIAITVVAELSELLPLFNSTTANGILHGMKMFVMHCHAESDCNIEPA